MSETESRRDEGLSKRFDPRFSPAFQPGYDPRVHREAPPSAPLRDGPLRDWPEARVAAPAQRRDWSAPQADGVSAEPDEFSIYTVPGSAEVEQAVVGVEDIEPAPWWRRINPWFVVLWALGIAIILLALLVANVIAEGAFQPNPNEPVGFFVSMLPQMVIFGLPSLICVGLATFVTPFIILAARWRRP